MKSSIKLFSVHGIDIKIHMTFPLILLWAAFQYGFLARGGWEGAIFGIITISLLFVLVTLHELGHSFAARYFGVPVQQIILLPIGGVAQLKHMPRKPMQEFIIALAGPAVNVGFVILIGILAILFNITELNPFAVLSSGFTLSFSAIFGYLFLYNIVLALFNMLPAFPMDGGRVLRALLAMRLDYGKATKIAVRIGQAFAVLIGIYGLFNGGFFMILIAFFVYNGASQEGQLVQQFDRLRGLTVRQAYASQTAFLSPYDTIQRAISLKLLGWQSNFPVFYNERMVGLLTERDTMEALTRRGRMALVGEVMSTHIVPVTPDQELFDVQQRMVNERLTALPVMEGTQYLGMITWRNINQLVQTLSARPDLFAPAQSA
ncbi:MAG: site-2 protease family protein [Chloroflexi bacterium]|nr:MAG: site-2 protease family protein [Chloroflexota bacterium]